MTDLPPDYALLTATVEQGEDIGTPILALSNFVRYFVSLSARVSVIEGSLVEIWHFQGTGARRGIDFSVKRVFFSKS